MLSEAVDVTGLSSGGSPGGQRPGGNGQYRRSAALMPDPQQRGCAAQPSRNRPPTVGSILPLRVHLQPDHRLLPEQYLRKESHR